jgi:hypothetical protein
MTVAYRSWVWNHKGKRPLGRPFRRWDDNVEVDLAKIVWRAWAGVI